MPFSKRQAQSSIQVWPPEPGTLNPHLSIPPPPTMHDIHEAFVADAVAVVVDDFGSAEESCGCCSAAGAVSHDNHQISQDITNLQDPIGAAAATAVVEAYASEEEQHRGESSVGCYEAPPISLQQQEHQLQRKFPASSLPSPHVPFMGFMDEYGVIHTESADPKDLDVNNMKNKTNSNKGSNNNNNNNNNNTKNNNNSPALSTRMSSISSSSITSTVEEEEEEKKVIPTSAEDILQASLTFGRSHPEKRFSSSLEHYYSSPGSTRHLYPSLEDVGVECPQLEPTDSVRSTVSGVLKSASSESILEASSMESSIAPEPPSGNIKPFVVAEISNTIEGDNTNNAAAIVDDDDDEVKMAIYSAEANAAPTYAVASVENVLVSSAEATVLETSQTPEEELLRKLEAEDAELIALKMSAYNCSGGSAAAPASSLSSHNDQQATVVAITEHYVHPSDISNNAVRAELIGEDYNNTVESLPATTAATSAASTSTHYSTYEDLRSNANFNPSTTAQMATGSVVAVEEPGYAVVDSEATIIDQEISWYPPQAEEAVVLNHDTSIPYSERKLPAVNSPPVEEYQGAVAAAVAVDHSEAAFVVGLSDNIAYPQSAAHSHQAVAFADEEAEVVAITEEFHPAEVTGNEAQAELVAIAEDMGSPAMADGPECATATASFEATASLASDQAEGVQAATVLGYEDDFDCDANAHVGMSRARSLGPPVPDRISPVARANSAPSAVGTRVSFDEAEGAIVVQEAVAELETLIEEDSWMRTPSFSGEFSDPVVVIQPPRDGQDEGPHAVAVASIDAYASSQTQTFDDTDCYSPGQPTMALNAFASSEFDATDCRQLQVNIQEPLQPQESNGEVGVVDIATEPAMPPPRSLNSIGGASDAASVGSNASSRVGFQKISANFAKGMELLFGDAKSPQGRRGELGSDGNLVADSVVPRELLPWSVIHSEATNHWVATVNTNQKALDSNNVVEASKSLRAFSVVAEQQASCLARAWSPPRMVAFSKTKECTICKSKFAVFRRACHCRNCGICVCTNCVVNWPAKMVPETYNIKKESFVNICKACDWLCTSFRVSLLEGNRDKAIALHATGNINLVTPFANVKGELFYPVHCAALGGNLELLKWLVDDNCCPIKSVRVSGRCRDAANSFTEISTSKGRSLLGIALENCNVGIVRYLVVEKGIQLAGEKDITMDTLCRNLDLVLRFLPEDAARHPGVNVNAAPASQDNSETTESAPSKLATHQPSLRALDDAASDGSVSDACIICFDATINCVATPCGHQICCIECSKNITKCPVCAADCTFMRVFRP